MAIDKVYILKKNGKHELVGWAGEYNRDILGLLNYEEYEMKDGIPVLRERPL